MNNRYLRLTALAAFVVVVFILALLLARLADESTQRQNAEATQTAVAETSTQYAIDYARGTATQRPFEIAVTPACHEGKLVVEIKFAATLEEAGTLVIYEGTGQNPIDLSYYDPSQVTVNHVFPTNLNGNDLSLKFDTPYQVVVWGKGQKILLISPAFMTPAEC